MKEALVFNKSQKMGSILLILLTCASLFLRPEHTPGSTYLLAVIGWPLVIFCLNLFKPHEVVYVLPSSTVPAAPATDPEQKV